MFFIIRCYFNKVFWIWILEKTFGVHSSILWSSTDPPQLSGSENITIEEQEDLVLVCDMKANPLITYVTWTLNESTVDLIAGGFTVTNDGRTSRLQVNNVEQSLHDGVYQCNASSSAFPNKTKTFYVNVTGKFTASDVHNLFILYTWWSSPPPPSSADRTIKFPLVPLIAGVVVVFVTSILAVVSRWRKIVKVTHKADSHAKINK